MEKSKARRNLKLYYVFQLLREPLFWGPIVITYMQRVSGMTLSSVYLMESVCLFLVMLLQVPTGALADRFGRRRVISLGLCLCLLEELVFGIASTAWMVWAADLIWVLGFSLLSGADSSLLYDSLKVLGREGEYKKIEGRSVAYRLAVVAVTSVSVGYLANWNLRFPVFLSASFVLVACVVTFFFSEPPRTNKEQGFRPSYWELMKLSVLFVANHRRVKWVIAFTTLITVSSKAWFFSYNPYFELVGLPLTYYGWVYCLLSAVAAVTSFQAEWLSQKLGDRGSVVLMLSMIAVPILLMGSFVGLSSVFLVLCQNVTRGYMTPFMGHFLHRYLDSENRATVMSVSSSVRGLGEFLTLGAFSLGLKVLSLPNTLLVLGFLTLVVGSLLVVAYNKVFVATPGS